MIMKFLTYGSPMTVVLRHKFHPEILRGSSKRGRRTRKVGKISYFLDLSVNISKTVEDTAKVTIND